MVASPTRTPGLAKRAPLEGASPFKKDLGKAPSTSRVGRSAFSDKTNQSPSPARGGESPSKRAASPTKGQPWLSTAKKPVFTRQNSFVTPAANIGRAGQIKARLAEMHDAAMDADVAAPASPVHTLTEDELYPEIESMPTPSAAPYHFPAELDGMPRAADIGRMLADAPWPVADLAIPTVDDVTVPSLPSRRRPAPRKGPPSRAPTPAKVRTRTQPAGHDALASQADAFVRQTDTNGGFVL